MENTTFVYVVFMVSEDDEKRDALSAICSTEEKAREWIKNAPEYHLIQPKYSIEKIKVDK